jgi:hypothetical protein
MSVLSKTASTAQVTDDATFRVHGKWFSDSWQTLGWTKVTDAGQIDWTSCTRAAGGASSGYEVRQSTDAGGATIYFKIEYVAGSNTGTSSPEFYLTFGTGQNGSGTLTGTVSTRFRWGMYAAGATSGVTYTMSGTTARWAIIMCETHATTSGTYGNATCCQRTCDADGTDNATGFIYAMANANAASGATQWQSGYIDFSTGQAGEDTGPTWMWMQATPRFTADKPVFFPLYVRGTNSHVMVRDMVSIPTVMAYPRTVTTLTHYGSSKKFISGTQSAGAAQNGYAPPVAFSLCVRAE